MLALEAAKRPQRASIDRLKKLTSAIALREHPHAFNDDVLGKFYGQAERPISTGKLHALLRFHLPPIKVVVFDRPSYAAVAALGDLISG